MRLAGVSTATEVLRQPLTTLVAGAESSRKQDQRLVQAGATHHGGHGMDIQVSDGAASFDMIVMVDWSAAASRGPARPIPDRCWVAWTHVDDTLPPQARYFRTRPEAEAAIADLLAAVRGNVLVGFDFPFGYPAGSGLGGGRSLAARLAALIDDGPDGANNRFAVAARLNDELNGGQPGPFWGCPAHAECTTLTVKRSGRRGGPFTDSRRADARLLCRGIQSCWKLYTRGSVGGQMLVGLPAIHRLLTRPGVGNRARRGLAEPLQLPRRGPSDQGRTAGDRRLCLGAARPGGRISPRGLCTPGRP